MHQSQTKSNREIEPLVMPQLQISRGKFVLGLEKLGEKGKLR
jgi:hypothetical protein